MTEPLTEAPELSTKCVWFFDFDRTLAEIEPRLDQVVVPGTILQGPRLLAAASDSASALISGCSIVELDVLTKPYYFLLAGMYRAGRRDTNDKTHIVYPSDAITRGISVRLRMVIAQYSGAELEAREMAFVLHYRQAPQHEDALMTLVRRTTRI